MTNDTDADIRVDFEEFYKSQFTNEITLERLHLIAFNEDDGNYYNSYTQDQYVAYLSGIEQGKRIENEACAQLCEIIGNAVGGSFGDGCSDSADKIRARINHDR